MLHRLLIQRTESEDVWEHFAAPKHTCSLLKFAQACAYDIYQLVRRTAECVSLQCECGFWYITTSARPVSSCSFYFQAETRVLLIELFFALPWIPLLQISKQTDPKDGEIKKHAVTWVGITQPADGLSAQPQQQARLWAAGTLPFLVLALPWAKAAGLTGDTRNQVKRSCTISFVNSKCPWTFQPLSFSCFWFPFLWTTQGKIHIFAPKCGYQFQVAK